ncbi:hypothetical protein [uncultured Tolumonas sp.]|uniref:hypothetical protein n=1 Tax=uncultured Tolumonas sp. TaxID=263765 RepID=UPI002A0A1225|nr:hypothetical protein [uncultured Tolumonas sp.]
MSYYKNETKHAIDVAERIKSAKTDLFNRAVEFSKLLNAEPVMVYSGTRTTFHGVKFPNGEFYLNAGLWTVPDRKLNNLCRPRKKVPATLKIESIKLHELWSKKPNEDVRADEIYAAIGLDYMAMCMSGGGRMFTTTTGIYIQSNQKPSDGSGTVEILGSEFEAAKSMMEKREDA